jgi:hypothetical protein
MAYDPHAYDNERFSEHDRARTEHEDRLRAEGAAARTRGLVARLREMGAAHAARIIEAEHPEAFPPATPPTKGTP